MLECLRTKVLAFGTRLRQLGGCLLVEILDPLHPLLGLHVSGEGWWNQPGCLFPEKQDKRKVCTHNTTYTM